MSTDQILFEHYDGVVDSPEAVSKLRKFILDLAVRGRLVEQDPDDEPASELLVRIVAIREKLSKSGSIKKINSLPHVDSSPYDVPTNWQWTRIRDVTSDRGQIVPETDFTYIDVSAINKEEGVVAEPKVMLPENAPSRARKLAKKNDVIYSCVRPYLLNVAIIDRDFDPKPIVSTAFAVLNGYNLVSPRYLWIALRSPFMIECVKSNQRGQAYPAINDSDFAKLPFPLPPLTEQCRIVAKVDELMEQCDRLDEKFKEREDHRKRFTKASFDSLTESGIDESEFKNRSGFVVKNFDRLTVDVGQIKNLQQLILDLAVRGKLVEQDPNDEPAVELLDRIRKEKQLLTESGAIRIQKPLPALDKLPFDLPSSWKWKRLGEIAEIVRGVSFPASAKSNAPGFDLLPCLRSGNIQRSVVWKELIYVPNTVVKDSSKFVRESDVLISIANSYELVGKCAIVHRVPLQATFGAFLAAIRLHLVSSKFAGLFLMSTYSSSAFRIGSSQTTNIANITFSTIRSHPFPLPPLAEQHRIVAKVDELIAQCEKLERNLYKTVAVRNHSLECLYQRSLPLN